MRCPDPRPALLVATTLAALGGCSAIGDVGSSAASTGSTLANLVRYGSTTVPPAAAAPVFESANCPAVIVSDGGSSLRQGSSQVSIANVARQCTERQGGSVVVKVGVEGRALLGPGSSSGRFDVPIRFALMRGDTVITSKVKRVSVTVPSGQAQASFVAIEDDLILPRATEDFDIVVGFGSGGAASPRAGRRG